MAESQMYKCTDVEPDTPEFLKDKGVLHELEKSFSLREVVENEGGIPSLRSLKSSEYFLNQ